MPYGLLVPGGLRVTPKAAAIRPRCSAVDPIWLLSAALAGLCSLRLMPAQFPRGCHNYPAGFAGLESKGGLISMHYERRLERTTCLRSRWVLPAVQLLCLVVVAIVFVSWIGT